MEPIIEFIVNNESIVMISLFAIIIVLLIIVIIIDKSNRKNTKNKAKLLLQNNDLDANNAFKEEIFEEYPELTEDLEQYKDIVVPQNTNNQKIEEIKYVESDEELEKTKAQIELKRLKEELARVEQEESNIAINPIKKNETINKEKIINNNEIDQENTAIISIDQFNKISDKKYQENELVQYSDEGNEPISIQELENLYNTRELKPIELESNFDLKQETVQDIGPKFKSSPVISPVFGINQSEDAVNLSLEATANLDKLSEEIRKTNEFLNTLKELKKNLQ